MRFQASFLKMIQKKRAINQETQNQRQIRALRLRQETLKKQVVLTVIRLKVAKKRY